MHFKTNHSQTHHPYSRGDILEAGTQPLSLPRGHHRPHYFHHPTH